MKNVVNVNCTWVADASKSRPTLGNAGTYISVASGAIAVMSTTAPNTVALNAISLEASGSGRSVVKVITFLSGIGSLSMEARESTLKKARS
ncbi:hypothetical protein [Rudaeicoccus suwonensis]|uniref:hypothetical protein n=1 Tax=Rudaeicoccus suwonensis TaxID=657409 RepID=UPI001FE7239D|nr:hypothetical protein [Rudaeicoccus suwonensis]